MSQSRLETASSNLLFLLFLLFLLPSSYSPCHDESSK